MSKEIPLPAIWEGEWLARFITVEWWIRSDKTIRQDAFVPPKDLCLSVTRHLHLSEADIWKIGRDVANKIAAKRKADLYGRADLRVHQVSAQNLKTEAAPLPDNPNHAHITGWPEKSARKNIAQRLAAAAGKCIPVPKGG
jgi:hypothetical protein